MGHATEQHVQEGHVRLQDKKGNDAADLAASCGVQAMGTGMIPYMLWVSERYKKYGVLVAQLQKLTAKISQEDKELRTLEEKKIKETNKLHKKDDRKFSGPLEYGGDQPARKLKFSTPPPNFAKDSEQHTEMVQIAAFLNSQEWHLASSLEQKGISWTELLILYELSGYKFAQTKEGIAEELNQARKLKDPCTMRWSEFLQTKGKAIRKVPYKPTSVKTIKTERDAFKKNVRIVIQCTADNLTEIAFSANECQSIHRFKALNVHGHEACIRARPVLNQQQVKDLT